MKVRDGALAVCRYAERVHRVGGDDHHVASPLGAWLLLALCSTVAVGRTRSDLEEVLGADADEAAELTVRLLANPHPLVGCAVGLWDREEEGSESVWTRKRGLPPEVQTGVIPTQAELDRWAERNTMGIIRKFPIDIGPLTVLIMASALATKVTWPIPFDTVPAGELGAASRWSTSLQRALRSPKQGVPQWQFIADTPNAGRVAVHVAEAQGGLRVVSVIAAEDVAALDVLDAAHRIATDLQTLRTHTTRLSGESGCTVCSLFDLRLGEEPRWVITEEPARTLASDGREEKLWTTLPAWSAQTQLDLTDDSVGFPAAASAVKEALALGDFAYEAKQSTAAQYSAVGFEAASITAMMVARGLPTYRDGIRRNAHLRFGHPYAAVAVTHAPDAGVSLWNGLPVFSAWITQPEDAHDAPTT